MAKSAKSAKTAKNTHTKARTKTVVKKFPRLSSVTKKGGD
jgi:hypothetical protein